MEEPSQRASLEEALSVRRQRIAKEKGASVTEDREATTEEERTSDTETALPPREQPVVKKLVTGLQDWSSSFIHRDKPMSVPDHAIPKTDEERAAHYLKRENQIIHEETSAGETPPEQPLDNLTAESPDEDQPPTSEPEAIPATTQQSLERRSLPQRARDYLIELRRQQELRSRAVIQDIHAPDQPELPIDQPSMLTEGSTSDTPLGEEQTINKTETPRPTTNDSLEQHTDHASSTIQTENNSLIENTSVKPEDKTLETATEGKLPEQSVDQSPQNIQAALIRAFNTGDWTAYDTLTTNADPLHLLETRSTMQLTPDQEKLIHDHINIKSSEEAKGAVSEQADLIQGKEAEEQEIATQPVEPTERAHLLLSFQEANKKLSQEKQLSDDELVDLTLAITAFKDDPQATFDFLNTPNPQLARAILKAHTGGLITDDQRDILYSKFGEFSEVKPDESPSDEEGSAETLQPMRQKGRENNKDDGDDEPPGGGGVKSRRPKPGSSPGGEKKS